jgi:hypothetical protein
MPSKAMMIHLLILLIASGAMSMMLGSQPEHTEYTAYQDKRMTEIEKRLDKLE